AVEETVTALAPEATPSPTATSSPTAAATPTPTPTPTSTYTPTATLTPDIPDRIPPRDDYHHDHEITEQYNESDDTTYVASSAPAHDVVTKSQFGIDIRYHYRGTEPAVPSTVLFSIVSRSDSPQYLNCHDLVILVDDDIRMTPQTSYLGDQDAQDPETDYEEGVLEGRQVLEMVYAFLDVEEFLQIVNADQVELTLCDDEWTLTSAELEALKDVASRMAPENDRDDVDS
ncbi:MAG: hypothetical protein ACLFV5_05520, partial [Anaerolineales bacterium]